MDVNMDRVSLFGVGFIGSWYAWVDDVVAVPRNELESPTCNILYMRSTVHNYHVKDDEPLVDIDTNLTHFMRVLSQNFYRHGTDLTFNLISTWFIYDGKHLPAQEDDYSNQHGFYSITSRCREQLLQSYAETFGFKYRILRLGNVIGIGDKKISRRKNALQHMIRELAQGRDVDYLYKGGSIRDYIDVRDCVKAIKLVLEKGDFNTVYNIANGHGLNVNDLVRTAWAESGYKANIKEIPVPEFHHKVQVTNMWMDISRIKKLGYVQTYDIKQSVRELTHYYETNEA